MSRDGRTTMTPPVVIPSERSESKDLGGWGNSVFRIQDSEILSDVQSRWLEIAGETPALQGSVGPGPLPVISSISQRQSELWASGRAGERSNLSCRALVGAVFEILTLSSDIPHSFQPAATHLVSSKSQTPHRKEKPPCMPPPFGPSFVFSSGISPRHSPTRRQEDPSIERDSIRGSSNRRPAPSAGRSFSHDALGRRPLDQDE